MASTASVLTMPSEPDLATLVDSGADRLTIRNIIYAAWSVFNSSKCSDAASPYLHWNVERMGSRGYLLLIHFGKGFRIGLHEMQIIHDVCPLRIDSVFVRDAATDSSLCALCVCLLDSEQPVQLTEAEVVRIRKRSRGILSTSFLPPSWFGGK